LAASGTSLSESRILQTPIHREDREPRLLELVPESDNFFSRFPNAIRKHEFHVTLRFVGGAAMPLDEEQMYRALEGSAVRVEPLVLLISSKLIALSVRIVDAAAASLCRNACPHVTMALAPTTKAYQSNEELAALFSGELLPRDSFATAVPVRDGLELVGIVQRYTS